MGETLGEKSDIGERNGNGRQLIRKRIGNSFSKADGWSLFQWRKSGGAKTTQARWGPSLWGVVVRAGGSGQLC